MESMNAIRAYGVCSPWSRLLSLVLDLVIGAAVIGGLGVGIFLAIPDTMLSPALALVLLAALYLLYQVVFLCLFGGLPAQLMLGQRVIDRDERAHLTPPAAVLRALGGAASFLLLGLGYLPMFFTARSQALHDFPSNAVVIRLHETGNALSPNRPARAVRSEKTGSRRIRGRHEIA